VDIVRPKLSPIQEKGRNFMFEEFSVGLNASPGASVYFAVVLGDT
jgi:hypothetical protein